MEHIFKANLDNLDGSERRGKFGKQRWNTNAASIQVDMKACEWVALALSFIYEDWF